MKISDSQTNYSFWELELSWNFNSIISQTLIFPGVLSQLNFYLNATQLYRNEDFLRSCELFPPCGAHYSLCRHKSNFVQTHS